MFICNQEDLVPLAADKLCALQQDAVVCLYCPGQVLSSCSIAAHACYQGSDVCTSLSCLLCFRCVVFAVPLQGVLHPVLYHYLGDYGLVMRRRGPRLSHHHMRQAAMLSPVACYKVMGGHSVALEACAVSQALMHEPSAGPICEPLPIGQWCLQPPS